MCFEKDEDAKKLKKVMSIEIKGMTVTVKEKVFYSICLASPKVHKDHICDRA